MVRALAGKEFRESIRSVRFLAVALVSCTLIPISAFVNTRSYEHRVRYHEELVEMYRTQTERAGLRADLVAEAFRPPSVLGILFRGIEPALPSRVQTSRDGLVIVLSENQPADPSSVPSDPTDLGFLTTIVLSLLAFVFVHGTIAGEKEEGTLRLLVSTGASRGSILLGKLFGGYSAFAIPVGCGLILGLAVVLSSPIVRAHLEREIPPLVIALFFVFALIFLLFLLAAFASMFAHRAGVAIVLLLFLWVFLVLALPRMAPMIAQMVYPAKPHHVVEMEKRLVKASHEMRFREVVDSLYQAVLNRHGFNADSLDLVFPNLLTGKLKKAHDEYEMELERVEASYQAGIQAQWQTLDSIRGQAYASQERLSLAIAWLSPVWSFSRVSSTLAGTGPDEWGRSLAFAHGFQDQVSREWYDKWIIRPYGAYRSTTMPAGGTGPQADGRSGPQVMDRGKLLGILAPASTSERLRYSIPDMLILAGMTLFAGLGCWFKFQSYDAR